MKKTSVLILAFLTLLLGACDKEEVGQVNPDNSLQMYGMNYPLTHGVLWHEIPSSVVEYNTFTFYDVYTRPGFDKESRDTIEAPSADVSDQISGKFIISLYGENVTFNPSERQAYGKSNTITFHLSVSQDEFEVGTYTFSKTNEPQTFFGYSSINYNFTDKAGAVNPIDSGELIVKKDGDIYEISFDCKSVAKQPLRGKYRGPLQLMDNREISLIEVKDVELSGLSDVSYIFDCWSNPQRFYLQKFDYYSPMFCVSSNGLAISQGGCNQISDPKLVDLAYINYYPNNDRCAFISPVTMRQYMNHMYVHKNHTKFINDVAASGISFTVADFDKLTSADGDFFRNILIQSDNKDVPVDISLPRVVLFQNSYGVKGAIKIKEIVPIHLIDKPYEDEVNYVWVYHNEPGGGYVRFDIKMQKTSVMDKIK